MCKKIIALIFGAAAMVLSLVSCQIPGLNLPPIGGGGGGNGDFSRLVRSDDELDLIEVRQLVMDLTGGIVAISPASEAAIDGEIVFGDTDRAVTTKAKAALAEELSDTEYDCGIIVYSDGKNVAVYWDLDGMAELAVPLFIRECLSEDTLSIPDGVVYTEFYKKDEFQRDKAWALIEAKADPQVVSALKELYAYYEGTKLAGWCANLYDPEVGGFYYSISARDTAGFYPDMESTSQLLSLMVSNGAFKDRNVALPESIRAKILDFIKGNQSKKDGYFYHPQWPQDKSLLNTDRYGRDQGWATGLINSITLDTDGDGVQEKQYPNYCITMKGLKCEKHTKDGGRCVFPISEAESLTAQAVSDRGNITDVIGVGVCSAVAKVREATSSVIATATVSDHPDYSSREAFSAWLEQYNNPEKVKESSGKAHNLSAISDEIAAHGMLDIVLNQLDRIQAEVFEEQKANGEDPTGLWQRNVDYKAVWGLLKYMSLYNKKNNLGREIKVEYLPYIIKTCVKVIQLAPSDEYHMNDLYNQWTGIVNLITNVKKWNPDSEQIIYEIIRENSAPLISNSLAKIEDFKIGDGSIGYTPGGISLSKIYGVPISLGIHEGDVNAASLCCSMYRSICSCLGYAEVPIFTEADGKMFVNILVNSEPITKNEIKAETIDFEDDTIPTSVSFSKGSGNATATVEADPKDSSNRVLNFTSPALSSGSGGTLTFTPATAGSGCYIFESRMYVYDADGANYMFQLQFEKTLYMIALHRSGNNVVIRENSSAASGYKERNVATVPMNEWFTLRVEYYSADADSEDGKPFIKIWVNGELVVSDSQWYYDSHIDADPGTSFTGVVLRSMRAAGTYIYLDDCYCAQETKSYDPSDDTISDARG